MPRSSTPRRPASRPPRARLQTAGLFLTLLAVAVLVGSLAAGLVARRGDRAASAEPAGEARRAPEVPEPPARAVRVEVQNASGRPGLAREATGVLRDAGIDVLEFGNAPRGADPERSVVLDRAGRLEAARRVADALGITRVEAHPDSNLFLDATVILGRDWRPDSVGGR